MVYVVMGVAGCGKTTIGKMLADILALDFFDADDYHSQDNINKMKSGIPLGDDDRLPWLANLASCIRQHNNRGNGAVLACSALKERYRKILATCSKEEEIKFIYLKADKDTIVNRLNKRHAHFFPLQLMESQLEILEVPLNAITVQSNKHPEEICAEIIDQLSIRKIYSSNIRHEGIR